MTGIQSWLLILLRTEPLKTKDDYIWTFNNHLAVNTPTSYNGATRKENEAKLKPFCYKILIVKSHEKKI